jgi:hypothetical protein
MLSHILYPFLPILGTKWVLDRARSLPQCSRPRDFDAGRHAACFVSPTVIFEPIRREEGPVADQEKREELTVTADEAGRTCIRVDRSRAEALRDYLHENGFPSTHVKNPDCDLLTLGSADPEEVQKLVDEWKG